MQRLIRHPRLAVLMVALLTVACGEGPPISVTQVQIGKSRNTDKTVAQPLFQFKPSDTIHVAVITDGEGKNAKVRALWTYSGGVISDVEQIVTQRDHSVTPFELRSSGGFPLGEYKLEVFLNGTSASVQKIHVR